MSMLPGVLELPGVPDVERLCRGVLAEATRAGVDFEAAEFDDMLAFLVAQAWIEHRDYRAGSHIPMRAWLFHRLRQRLTDELRRVRGRSGQKRPVAWDTSVDEAEPAVDDVDDDFAWLASSRARRLARLLADGHSQSAIAARLGVTDSQAAAEIAELRAAVLARGLAPSSSDRKETIAA